MSDICILYIKTITCRLWVSAAHGKSLDISTARLCLKCCFNWFVCVPSQRPRLISQGLLLSTYHKWMTCIFYFTRFTAYIAWANCAKSLQPSLPTTGNHFICFGLPQFISSHQRKMNWLSWIIVLCCYDVDFRNIMFRKHDTLTLLVLFIYYLFFICISILFCNLVVTTKIKKLYKIWNTSATLWSILMVL